MNQLRRHVYRGGDGREWSQKFNEYVNKTRLRGPDVDQTIQRSILFETMADRIYEVVMAP